MVFERIVVVKQVRPLTCACAVGTGGSAPGAMPWGHRPGGTGRNSSGNVSCLPVLLYLTVYVS